MKILDELPSIIFKLFNIEPDILAYYPTPKKQIPYENEERNKLLREIATEKIDSLFSNSSEAQNGEAEDNGIIKFSDMYVFSEDEANMVLGRRYSGSSYPEEVKDKEEFNFFLENNFVEAGNSRMVYKLVGSD